MYVNVMMAMERSFGIASIGSTSKMSLSSEYQLSDLDTAGEAQESSLYSGEHCCYVSCCHDLCMSHV